MRVAIVWATSLAQRVARATTSADTVTVMGIVSAVVIMSMVLKGLLVVLVVRYLG